MMDAIDDEERRLKMDQMRADIAKKQADSEYKRGLLRFEPWKLVLTAFVAGGALVGGMTALLGYLAPHYPPPASLQMIQLPTKS